MIRRRRPTREIPFSFDSFLDIVANVVGIIIRLILVVWVGARSYSSLQHVLRQEPPPETAAAEPRAQDDPLHDEIARHRRELEQVQARLLEQLRQLGQAQDAQARVENDLNRLSLQGAELEREQAAAHRATDAKRQEAQLADWSLAELGRRCRELTGAIRELEKLPPPRKTLRYRTPVSRPVQAEELLFECKAGRVTFLDIAALLAEVRQTFDDKSQLLKTQWQVRDVAGPVGAFRLNYLVERDRGAFDGPSSAAPDGGSYRYGLSAWEAVPVMSVRGEPGDAALADGSEFRRVIDGIDTQLTVVTFWVYPDSFALYRRLRDFLYERDVVVAGRPLPDGLPIASSRRGSVSRGQ